MSKSRLKRLQHQTERAVSMEICPSGCIFVCPCPDGCNGCEIPTSKWKLLGDCRIPESDDCELNRRDRNDKAL